MTFSCHSHDFLMTFSWFSYDFLMTLSWLSQVFLMTFLWISHYFSWPSHDYLMNFSWLPYEFLMTFSWLSHDFLMIFTWLSDNFIMPSKSLLLLVKQSVIQDCSYFSDFSDCSCRVIENEMIRLQLPTEVRPSLFLINFGLHITQEKNIIGIPGAANAVSILLRKGK